jgi:hypothetical protein
MYLTVGLTETYFKSGFTGTYLTAGVSEYVATAGCVVTALPLEYKVGAGTLNTDGAARDKPAWPLDDDDDDVYFTAGVAEYKETAGDRFVYLTAGVTGVSFTTGPLE